MSHFASPDWNNPTGLVASLSTTGNVALEATASTSTEGTNKLTYTTKRAGTYLVTSYLRVRVASDAATSHSGVVNVAFNNGTAISATGLKNLGGTGVTIGTIDLKGTAGTSHLAQSGIIFAANATDIVLTVSEAISGAKTAGVGTYDIYFTISAL